MAATVRSSKAMTYSKCCCCRSIVTHGLVENMGEMIGDRFLRDPQLLRNLFVAFATGNQLEHGNLTLCQVGRKCRERIIVGRSCWQRKSVQLVATRLD